MNKTNEFMKRVGIVKEWFKYEELEVTDGVIGRFAARLGKLIDCQIDEDNKRFLGYVGEDEKLKNEPHDVFDDADKIAKNELRAELRDKINKQ